MIRVKISLQILVNCSYSSYSGCFQRPLAWSSNNNEDLEPHCERRQACLGQEARAWLGQPPTGSPSRRPTACVGRAPGSAGRRRVLRARDKHRKPARRARARACERSHVSALVRGEYVVASSWRTRMTEPAAKRPRPEHGDVADSARWRCGECSLQNASAAESCGSCGEPQGKVHSWVGPKFAS